MKCEHCHSNQVWETWSNQTYFSSKTPPCSYMPDGSQKYTCFECYRNHAGSVLESAEYLAKRTNC